MTKSLYASARGHRVLVPLLAVLILAAVSAGAAAAPLKQVFGKTDAESTRTVDHAAWDKLLKAYVVAGEDGLNRVDYARFAKEGGEALDRYLEALQQVDVGALNRPEQFAYWANLYNAKTVDIVLEHYPVASIRDIRLTSFVIPGPWKAKVVRVNGVRLSLDDIEHEILRPIWGDPRVHYAVNCAAIGCPNLQREAFTGAALERLLDAGARAYVKSPRGVTVTDAGLVTSKIYRWFQADFGGSEAGVLRHLARYADPERAAAIKDMTRVARYEYDWGLNDIKSR